MMCRPGDCFAFSSPWNPASPKGGGYRSLYQSLFGRDLKAGETCATCPGDCGACTQCGDGTCDNGIGESCATYRIDVTISGCDSGCVDDAFEEGGGDMEVRSAPGEGTRVKASFQADHIDLAPMGDVGGALTTLIMGNPHVDIVYTHRVGDRVFEVDTREMREELEGVALNHPDVILFLRDTIRSRPGEITLLTIGPLTNAGL